MKYNNINSNELQATQGKYNGSYNKQPRANKWALQVITRALSDQYSPCSTQATVLIMLTSSSFLLFGAAAAASRMVDQDHSLLVLQRGAPSCGGSHGQFCRRSAVPPDT